MIEEGYYWITYKEPEEADSMWTVAAYTNCAFYGKPGWLIVGSDLPMAFDDAAVISNKLTLRADV